MDGGQQTGRKAVGSVPPARPALRPGQGDLQRLEAALRIVAGLVIENPVYAPIFRRIERNRPIVAALAGSGDIWGA